MIGHLLTLVTNRIHTLPVLVLMPHSRCNCRCVMCDIWKANQEKKEISVDVLRENIDSFKRLGVKEVALSGGEALMHSNLWKFCEELKAANIRISLLSTGLLLSAHAVNVSRFFDEVIVSIDGGRDVHNAIRNIPLAFEKLEQGVAALKSTKPGMRIVGRCVIQKLNFREVPNIVHESRRIGLNQISFLPADVSSSAFNHATGWKESQGSSIALTREESDELGDLLHRSFHELKAEYESGFIAERPEKMLAMVHYYNAILGRGAFPGQRCNAPWVSAVVESNGDVMPCFFHKPYGNLSEGPIEKIINSPTAIQFRKNLNVKKDETCRKCVCSLYRSY